MNDLELRAFQRGDEASFRVLVERHSPRLLSLASTFARDGDEAHDLVQDTWIRAYRQRKSFAGRGSLAAWLHTICRNVCLAATRTRTARERIRVESAAHTGSPPAGPQHHTEQVELRRTISDALMELPPRQREVVFLRMLEGHSTRDTAQLLRCAEGTVKAALHAALKKLEPILETWTDDTP